MEKDIMEGETIVFRTEIHWVIFVMPFIYSFAILCFIFFQKILPILNIAGAALILYFCGGAWIRYLTVSYTLTNFRVIRRSGLIYTQFVDMSLDRIESVVLNQSLLGKVVNYGNVIINGTGGDRLLFDTLDQPNTFRQQIFTQMKKLQHGQE